MEVFALQSGAELAVAVAHEQACLIPAPPPPDAEVLDFFFFCFIFIFFYLVSVCCHFCPSR